MDYAARAKSSYALLSFAFTFFGTLPVNQSRLSYYTSIDTGRPHHKETLLNKTHIDNLLLGPF